MKCRVPQPDSLDVLIAEAEVGEEAKRFLDSDLGKAVMGIAAQNVELARIALGEIDPDDKKLILTLQNEIKNGLRFKQYVVDLFQSGEQAKEIYKQQRQE